MTYPGFFFWPDDWRQSPEPIGKYTQSRQSPFHLSQNIPSGRHNLTCLQKMVARTNIKFATASPAKEKQYTKQYEHKLLVRRLKWNSVRETNVF
jgi:hypothetical protein